MEERINMREQCIKVDINLLKDYPYNWPSDQMFFETWCISRLKEDGIPIKGVLRFNGLESGELHRYNDVVNPYVLHFEWYDHAIGVNNE